MGLSGGCPILSRAFLRKGGYAKSAAQKWLNLLCYYLGNRSALEWVIDQYQVSTDKRSGITNDPNRDDDKEYILRLIGQVITVSLETVTIVNVLPDLGLPASISSEETVQELGPEDFEASLRERKGKDRQNGSRKD